MSGFEVHEPASVAEASEMLQRFGDDVHVLAGGTSLVLLLSQGLIEPGHLVSLRRLDALRGHRATDGGGLEIGALCTHRELETSPLLWGYSPALAQAIGTVGTIRIRNQGTIGGNLAHADPAQDPPPALLVHDAQVVVDGPGGRRSIALADLFADVFETTLEPGEIITAVRLPPRPSGATAAYRKFLPRSKDDYATVSVAVSLRRDEQGVARDVRVALGSVGPVPLRSRAAEASLEGAAPESDILDAAAAAVRDDISPVDDLRGSADYKREMAAVWTRRAFDAALAGGGGARS